ncbi:MAG: glycosyltransferase [bacterium]
MLKGIHFGSYWMGTNDVVYLMSLDLKELCDLVTVDTGIYYENSENWYTEDFSHSSVIPIRWLNEQKVLELVEKEKPDFIIVNSGGMSLNLKTIDFLKSRDIVTIGISLSDPDVFNGNGKIYSEYYDLFYTNSLYALKNLYSKKTNIGLLPFAACTKVHHPLQHIEKIYDVVIIGHARPERIKTVKRLKKHFSIGLFGNDWGDKNKSVYANDHVKALNSGKIYLSFSKTLAGHTNVKVGIFEAIACKNCVVTQLFDEMEHYFKYGIDILGYVNEDMLIDLIDSYLKNERLRNWIANNAYRRLIHEHAWSKRFESVLNDIHNHKRVHRTECLTK